MYNNSTFIGNIGESVAIAEFSKRNIPVFIPLSQNLPFDLVILINNNFYRIQCKTTKNIIDNSKMRFNICKTNGFTNKHELYTKNEIDFFFLYCIENNYMGLVPVNFTTGREFILRTCNARNNQIKNIKMCDEYSLDYQLQFVYKYDKIIVPIYFV